MRRSDFYGEGLFIAFVFKAYIFPLCSPVLYRGFLRNIRVLMMLLRSPPLFVVGILTTPLVVLMSKEAASLWFNAMFPIMLR